MFGLKDPQIIACFLLTLVVLGFNVIFGVIKYLKPEEK